MPAPRRAFTLVELLVVVLIIGVLAAIAIPRFAATRGKAYVTAMMADLHNLATAESAYFADHQVYTTALTTTQYTTSAGVTVTINAATTTGWSAVASHAASDKTCAISYGEGATTDGVPICN